MSYISTLKNKNYTGAGYGFSSTGSVIEQGYVDISRNKEPNEISYIDSVELKEDTEFIDSRTRPINQYFSVEISPYGIVSEEMLHMLSSIEEFHNLIGEPINEYRQTYKGLDLLKEYWFDNIQNEYIDIDRYFEYYKWIDSSLTNLVRRLFPASANHNKHIQNIIESHVLERNKLRKFYHQIERKVADSEILESTVANDHLKDVIDLAQPTDKIYSIKTETYKVSGLYLDVYTNPTGSVVWNMTNRRMRGPG